MTPSRVGAILPDDIIEGLTPEGRVRTALDPTLCWETPLEASVDTSSAAPAPTGHTAARAWPWAGGMRAQLWRRRARRALALTSGKSPSAKTISSDVFPQPPSPTRTTLMDRALSGASSPSAWAAFIAGPAESRARAASAGLRARPARGWPGGAGMWKGRGGRRKCEPGGGGGGRPPRPGERPEPDPACGRRGVAAGLRPFPSHPIRPLNKHFLSTYCVRPLRPQGEGTQTRSLSSGGDSGPMAGRQVVAETVRVGVWTGKEEAPGAPSREGGGGQPCLPTSLVGTRTGFQEPVQVEQEQKPGLLLRGWRNVHFPKGSGDLVHHSPPSRCFRPGRNGMTGMPYGSVAGTARPCLPSPSQHWEVSLQVGDLLSHFWLGHDLGKAMESSIHKEFLDQGLRHVWCHV